ncbi:ABC transporter substrate-binding protein [Paenibacillus eucommiae]|uniref:Spermidine/putrescine transport system substrate-binding protein n=1 Tax=Paenibacillus eucommiae TaxID=1355755 RepID=A0ABS4J6F4_9BACL|nr:ABC transporter substrate-binding protein [Paenibacillus eucommiae]MBP1995403.1 putative spermidine/putrescine transport system substrate-binding protein [Paenibacillus eucommiae]
MIKKMMCVLFVLVLTVALAACAGTGSKGTEDDKPTNTGSGNASTNPSTNTPNGASSELVVVSFGGNMAETQRKAIYKPFEEKYKVKIREVSPTDLGKLKAMVESGNVEWDVVDVGADFAFRGGKQGLLEKLDYNVIQKDGIYPEFVSDYGIGAYLFYVPIAYSLSDYSEDNHPKTWSEFWDTQKFPGKRSLWSIPQITMEQALLADGVKKEELYPLDIDRAFKSLDKIKKNVSVFWKNGDQPAQALVGGDASLATGYNGRLMNARKDGVPIGIEYNQVTVGGDAWVIPKGSKNKDLAMKFIAFATEPEQQANLSKINDIAPANKKSYELLSEEDKTRLGIKGTEQSQVIINMEYWAENYDQINERYQKWMMEK